MNQASPMSEEEIRQRNLAQYQQIMSPINRWCAGVYLGHSPSDQEALIHFATQGGAEKFAEDWNQQKNT